MCCFTVTDPAIDLVHTCSSVVTGVASTFVNIWGKKSETKIVWPQIDIKEIHFDISLYKTIFKMDNFILNVEGKPRNSGEKIKPQFEQY